MCRVPQELVDAILNELDDDDNVPALRNCGLVCHNWLPSARSHLFRDITLDYEIPSETTDALEILKSSPEIALAIRSFEIAGDHRADSSLGEISKFLCSLTRLEELTLCAMDLYKATNSNVTTFVKSLAAVTPTVKIISIYAVTFHTFSCLSHILRAFPLLSCIDLSDVWLMDSSTASPLFHSLEGHIPRIKEICLSMCDAPAQMAEMLLDPERIYLEASEASDSISVFSFTKFGIFSYLKLIEGLGARIYHLNVSLGIFRVGFSAAEMCYGQLENLLNLN